MFTTIIWLYGLFFVAEPVYASCT